jgi:hypothetical protein
MVDAQSFPLMTREELVNVFGSSIRVFEQLQMHESAKSVQHVMIEAKQKQPNRPTLNSAFLVLQEDVRKEYSSSIYRARIYNYITSRVSAAMEDHHDEVVKALNTPGFMQVPKERLHIFQTLNALIRILFAGAKTDSDKALAGSIAYSYAVEGIYKMSVRDCYVWERLGCGQEVDTEKVVGMDIMHVFDYYRKNELEMVIFEGYDNTVRNAVSHATFYYDAAANLTSYEDRRKGAAVRFSFIEIEDKYQKLKELYQYILIKNVLINVSDACARLLKGEWK